MRTAQPLDGAAEQDFLDLSVAEEARSDALLVRGEFHLLRAQHGDHFLLADGAAPSALGVRPSPPSLAGRNSAQQQVRRAEECETKRVAGRCRGPSGLPHSSRRPRCMTPMRSASAKASSWSWVTRMVVMSSSRWIGGSSVAAPRGSWHRARRTARPSAAPSGRCASARATATRCCWPPDSCVGSRSSMPSRATSSSSSLRRARALRALHRRTRSANSMFSPTVMCRNSA